MLSYASENQVCRSRQLLLYFGQDSVEECGHCDVCLSKNELDISRFEFNTLSKDLLDKLAGGSLMNDELVDSVEGDKKKILKVLRHLCDQGQIHYNKEKHIFFI